MKVYRTVNNQFHYESFIERIRAAGIAIRLDPSSVREPRPYSIGEDVGFFVRWIGSRSQIQIDLSYGVVEHLEEANELLTLLTQVKDILWADGRPTVATNLLPPVVVDTAPARSLFDFIEGDEAQEPATALGNASAENEGPEKTGGGDD